MAKQQRQPQIGRQSGWRWIGPVAALLVLAAAAATYYWRDNLFGQSTRERSAVFSLPATPRNPRPATLPPDLFTGKIARAYQVAREIPEVIEQMPCYCGCYRTDNHQNNLDCYVDRHASA